MKPLDVFLQEHSSDGIIALAAQREAVHHFNQTFPAVEEATLKLGILPERYRRNPMTISAENQLRLFQSHVAVIGCGGLGGYVMEALARIGMGKLTVIDPDVFEEHNLNRQVLATLETLNIPKVEAAVKRVGEINPAITVRALRVALTQENGPDLLGDVQVAIDGLDSISCRIILAEVCDRKGIPLIHGSIAGWYGQVTTQFPGDHTLQMLYGEHPPDKGIEQELGNPSFMPPLVAGLEVAEAVKVLVNEGTPLRRRLLSINLLDMEVVDLPVGT